MNQIIVYNHEILERDSGENGNSFLEITDKERLAHLNQYIRPEIGETLRLVIVNQGRIANAKVVEVDPQKIVLNFRKDFVDKTLPSSIFGFGKNLQIIVGLSRPPTLKKIFEHATTMGVTSFQLISTELTEKSYATSKILNDKEEYNRYFRLGLSQSTIYYNLPTIEIYKNARMLKLNILEGKDSDKESYKENCKNKFILSAKADKSFADYQLTLTNAITSEKNSLILAIGPERGFTEEEESFFVDELNFHRVKISNSILRVEHALFHALAQLELMHL